MSTNPSGQGQDRPELQKAIEESVEAGFVGVQLRVNDERGDWVGSAGASRLGRSARPLTNGHFRIGSSTKSKLLPAGLLAEMRTPEATVGHGLGVFAQETAGGTVLHHNGATMGSAALMCSAPDGTRPLAAGLTWVDDADLSMAPASQAAQQRFVEEVFCGKLGR
ncbi:hypothetical protein OG689_36315 [Kitasatospora sp. NBC_00240]|uniref:hypothetical protein n=1 Tax=Kitasatospora sp. NBC_00240 TaxID=2903567 RepID=UPI00224DB23B|nr:hypothetical protein [Kitasatospora sp. NBC_00240]MCX5214662.1 hypothetical protein [Kitasatospora sp. NBC_00240]